jgi:hypothetical protein
MPISKHRKKGQSSRQWRRKGNLRRLQVLEARKAEKVRAMRNFLQAQEVREAEQEAEQEIDSQK